MSEEAEDRTEAPTAKRKRDAAKEGNVLRSKDFGTALVTLAGCGWLAMFGSSLMGACKAIMASSFSFGRGDVEDFEPFRPLFEAGWKLAPAMLSLFAVAIVAALASQGALGSFQFNAGLLAPKASRINPGSGLKRIFGMQGWIELGKSLSKVILLGAIGWFLLKSVAHTTIGMAASDIGTAVGALGGTFTAVLFTMAGGLVLIAGIDVPLQMFQLLKKLSMSKQEIRDEHKESEGSPENKAHIRQKQREIVGRKVREAVESAHVVLTNPTHFAVALRYDRGQDQVPVVVAKGRGATALAIRELAAEKSVPVLEYPQLARAVYYTSRENQEIRDDLYQAVAAVLAFVFGVNQAAGTRAPQVVVPDTARFDENGVKQG